jgi:twitching motility protein PilT
MEPQIEELMEELVKQKGSDLHLSAGHQPYGRFNGELRPMRQQALSEEVCNRMILSMLSASQRQQLEQTWELDCGYALRDLARFRINVFSQRGSFAASMRALNSQVPTPRQLGLPAVVVDITKRPSGLVLVTGPTGSGKSTTLACLLDHINHSRAEHIITIEDPIEFIYTADRSLIHQRQLNEDTKSFSNALRAALREDPDVILVGEMRDLETIQLAITAAETGHLVFATLHTSSAAQTVDRMVDVFPAGQQAQVRSQLSNSLAAIFAQTLCRRSSSSSPSGGRVMAQEIMINTPALANLIREAKTAQIYSQIQTGGQQGMQTMEKALAELVKQGAITREEARNRSSKPDELNRLLGHSL